MPGTLRRNKPLKAKTALGDINDFSISNPLDGDLLVFDIASGLWENTKTLDGSYSMTGELNLATLVTSGALTVGTSLSVGTDLFVTGDIAVTDDLTADEATFRLLNVTSSSILSGTLSVAGALTGSGFSFSGSGTVTGTLSVTGSSTLSGVSASVLLVTGPADVQGSFSVGGFSAFSDDVIIDGSLSVSGNVAGANIIGPGTVSGGTLAWDGTAWKQSTVITQGPNAQLEINAPASSPDSGIRFSEAGVLQYRFFHDDSANTVKHRLQNAGDMLQIEEGNGTNIAAIFTPNASQAIYDAGVVVLDTQTDGLLIGSGQTTATRIRCENEFTSAPAGTLTTGQWEMSVYDDGATPVFRVRYNDGGTVKSVDLGPLV